MKKSIFLSTLALTFIFTACGPASEDRKVMHERAKVFQDSIANVIRTAMAEAEAPANNVVTMQAPAPGTATAQQTQTANPNPNTGANQTPGQPYTKSK